MHRLLLPPAASVEADCVYMLSFFCDLVCVLICSHFFCDLPCVSVIENVIVNQGSSVDDLDRRGQYQDLVVGSTSDTREATLARQKTLSLKTKKQKVCKCEQKRKQIEP